MSKHDIEVVVVFWRDAALHGTDQRTREEAIEHCGLVDVVSVGHVIHEDDEKIIMATDWQFDGDQFRNISTIPKTGIQHTAKYKAQAISTDEYTQLGRLAPNSVSILSP